MTHSQAVVRPYTPFHFAFGDLTRDLARLRLRSRICSMPVTGEFSAISPCDQSVRQKTTMLECTEYGGVKAHRGHNPQ